MRQVLILLLSVIFGFETVAQARIIQPSGTIVPYAAPKARRVETCRTRGGIDCKKGADATDGSVICIDDFKDSVQQFNDECTTAKLNLIDTFEEGGETIFIIKNISNIEAEGINVFLRSLIHEKKVFNGPTVLPSFGIGEYRGPKKQKLDYLVFDCENCKIKDQENQ